MKQAQKENPFNFKFNKSKHDIVGKPNPIYKKRKRTIPLEVPERSRSRLIDKRIGKSTETKSYEFEDPSHEETLTHFGQKVDDISVFPELSESEPDEPARTKSRNEIITEIIEKSKRYKRERQMQKEHDEMIRHEIDQDLETIRELMPVMNNSAYVEGSKSDYDTVMKEMSFDMRAKPTDRIKTDEELAMEAKVKLERLEKERLKRMNESSDDNHDTDEDSIERNSEVSNEIMPLTYKDGVLVNKEIFMKPCRDGGLEANESELESNISNDETDSCSESDLEEDQMSTERAPELHSDNIELPENEKSEIIAPTESGTLVEESEPPEMEELPFLFDAPATYSDFTQLLEGRDQMQTNLILERLQIQYNPKLGAENVAVLQKLMIFILKHIITVPYNQDFFAILKNHFIPMAKEFPNHYLKWIKARVIYLSSALESRRVKQKSLFSTGDLFIFQTVKQIYSISDFQHPAVTPLVLLWCQYLQTAPVLSYRDVLSKLLISQLLTDIATAGKRFIPELFQFIPALIGKLLGKVPKSKLCTLVTFSPDMKISNFNVQTVPLTFNDLKSDQKMSDAYLVSCLQECLLILTQLLPIYAQSPAVVELFHPIIDLIESIPMDTEIGEYIRNTIRKWRLIIEATTLRRKPLQLQARKALAIKTYNPKFHENYSVDRKSYDPDRELRDARKLKQEYKKEMKGAIRELRIEAATETRSKIAQIKQKDVQYKRKMDKIRGNLAEQEGAMRGYERENKKAKFKLQKGKKSSESQ